MKKTPSYRHSRESGNDEKRAGMANGMVFLVKKQRSF